MDVPVAYLQSPAVPTNQALDLLGQPGKIIGDITDGTPVAEAARRNYGQGLRQLLRTAHWNFARKFAPLNLLADATGNTADISTYVDSPWTYAYEWPIDAVQGRWMPWSPTSIQPTDSSGRPLTTGVSALTQYPMIPGRFLVSSSDQYPVQTGMTTWDQLPDLQRTEGVGPINRKVILTDCAQPNFVYTRLVPVIEEWDDLFRQAFVTMLALVLAPTAIEDPKLRSIEVERLRPVLKNAIADARLASANESGFPQTTDHEAAWISARNQSGWRRYAGFSGIGGIGYTSCGWESLSWSGSVY